MCEVQVTGPALTFDMMANFFFVWQDMQQAWFPPAPDYRAQVLNTLIALVEAPQNDPYRVPDRLFIAGPVQDQDSFDFIVPGIGPGGTGVRGTLTLHVDGSSHGPLRPLNAPPDDTVRNTYSVRCAGLVADNMTLKFAIQPSSSSRSANRRCASQCLRVLLQYPSLPTTTGSAV